MQNTQKLVQWPDSAYTCACRMSLIKANFHFCAINSDLRREVVNDTRVQECFSVRSDTRVRHRVEMMKFN